MQVDRLNVQHQDPLTWEPSFNVVRALIDQAVRAGDLSGKQLDQVNKFVDRAERFSTGPQANAAKAQLKAIANQLPGEQFDNLRGASSPSRRRRVSPAAGRAVLATARPAQWPDGAAGDREGSGEMSEMVHVVAASYDRVEDALADFEAVDAAYRHVSRSHDFDATVVARDEAGKVEIVRRHDEHTRHSTGAGFGWGFAIGAVAALFPAVGILGALAAGAGGGAALGALAGHAARVLSRDDLKALGEVLDRGDAGLVDRLRPGHGRPGGDGPDAGGQPGARERRRLARGAGRRGPRGAGRGVVLAVGRSGARAR